MSRGSLDLGVDDEGRVMLRFSNGGRHMTALLTAEEARVLVGYLQDTANKAELVRPARGHA